MTDKEILELIVEQGNCCGIHCDNDRCPINDDGCLGDDEIVAKAKQKLKEMECEMCDIPELKGVKMLVSDDGEDWHRVTVLCKCIDNLYYYDTAQYRWQYAKPLPKPEEMTLAEICKELGREIKVKKG